MPLDLCSMVLLTEVGSSEWYHMFRTEADSLWNKYRTVGISITIVVNSKRARCSEFSAVSIILLSLALRAVCVMINSVLLPKRAINLLWTTFYQKTFF